MPKTLKTNHRKQFLKQINADTLQEINNCYQCGKCSSGCPVADEMDLTPSQIIHAIRLGQKDMVENSKAIWLCASCETCTTRCPHGVDIAGAMDAARRVIFTEGLAPADNKAPSMHKSFLESVRMFG
jgi:heterodisulfide reductase subunit C